MTFRVGMKVVCIYPGPWFNRFGHTSPDTKPVKDTVYTIRGIFLPSGEPDLAGLYLEEIVNPVRGEIETAFNVVCFRRVVENKTDISALTALLNPTNHSPFLPEDELDRVLLDTADEALR